MENNTVTIASAMELELRAIALRRRISILSARGGNCASRNWNIVRKSAEQAIADALALNDNFLMTMAEMTIAEF